MQLWMCLRNLTNSPMPAANHLLFFPSSGDMEHDWQMIGQHRKSDVQVESNQMTVSGTGSGGGWTSNASALKEKLWCWGCFWSNWTELQYWAQLSERKDKHQMMPFYFLSYWTANTISSANWPQNKQTHIHNLGSVICCFHSNNAIMSLREPCKGDCYLVFHIHDSGPSWGQSIDFLFFLFISIPGIRCPCLWNFFLRSALLTLPLNFEDPEAAVIFSESICLIRGSLMEADNLSPAPWTGLHVSSACYGKSFRGITELTEADSHCWWQAWF